MCPKEKDLEHIRWLELWSEGAGGDVHLEVQSISANLNIPQRSSNIVPTIIDIPLVTFDGEPATTFKFRQYNDPVMVRKLSQ